MGHLEKEITRINKTDRCLLGRNRLGTIETASFAGIGNYSVDK